MALLSDCHGFPAGMLCSMMSAVLMEGSGTYEATVFWPANPPGTGFALTWYGRPK